MFFNNKKDYDETIKEIRGGLTDDKQENIKYLKKQTQKYKTHKMAKEIIKEIGRMIADNLPEEDLKKIQNVAEKDIIIHYEKAMKHIEERNYEKAKKEMQEFLKISNNMFKEDQVSKYFSPSNPLEFLFICEDNKEEKQIRDTGMPFSIGYCALGSIFIDENELEEARKCFENSIKWNPYNIDAMFEKAETYKIEKRFEEFKKITEESYKYIYKPQHLARYYRNLGYYFIEQEEYQLAISLELYSIQIDDQKGNTATREVMYAMEKSGKRELPDIKEIINNLTQNNIPVFVDPRIVGLTIALKKDMISKDAINSPLGNFVNEIANFYLKFLGE